MKHLVILLAFVMFFVCSCDNKKEESAEKTEVSQTETSKVTDNTNVTVAQENSEEFKTVEDFVEKYNKMNEVEQYYFCTAFTIVALASTKPTTASAITPYFLGVGEAKSGKSIDEEMYKYFDLGKNIIRQEAIVNYLLDDKSCEKVIEEFSQDATKKKLSTEDLIESGNMELQKVIVFNARYKKAAQQK